MLDRQHGNVIFECDDCGEVLDTKTSNFEAAHNLMKRQGWAAQLVNEQWQHFCSQCKDW
jgi:hypothetical protein